MLLYVIGVILLIIVIILIKTIRFKPLEEKDVEQFFVDLDEDKIVHRFREMIQVKTISYKDIRLEDEKEFIKFKDLIIKNYPAINDSCKLYNIGRTGVLYHWKGNSSDKPIVFMAHYDVVPVSEDQWDKEPFSAIIEERYIWGRGTLDTKGTLCGIVEAAEKLIREGFVPENDIYLSFSGDEETTGESAKHIVQFLEENSIKPFMVLDEGGAIVQGAIPGVKGKCALIGTGEKGKMHIRLSIKSQGGHASTPPPVSSIGRLSRAVTRIESNPFKFYLSQPVRDMFNIVGRHSTFGLKMIFANINLFSPLLSIITKKAGGELNALVRTTTAFTKMSGSDAVNVFPPYASIEGDIRIMQGDTSTSIIEGLKQRINDDKIVVEALSVTEVAPFSSIENRAWEILETSIRQVWQETIVSPYLVLACTDARSFTKICENVYRFSAMELDSEERKLIHGNNERIPVDKLITVVKFYLAIMQKC